MIFRNKLQKPDSSCLVAETSFRNQTSLQYRILRNLFGICRTGAPVPVERLLKRTNASQGSIGENWVHFPFFLQVNPNLARSKHFERQDSRIPRHTLGRPKHSPNHSSSYFEPNSSMASPWTHHHGSRTRLTCSKFQRVKKELNQNRRLPWGEAWSDQPLCCSGRSSWGGEERIAAMIDRKDCRWLDYRSGRRETWDGVVAPVDRLQLAAANYFSRLLWKGV